LAAKLGRQARSVVLLTALAVCAVASLLASQAGFGQVSDTVCDQTACAQLGYERQMATLWVQNTAASGGANVTGETLSITGATITGVSGTNACQPMAGNLDCNATIAPGASFTASTIVTDGQPALGTPATATLVVNGVQHTFALQVLDNLERRKHVAKIADREARPPTTSKGGANAHARSPTWSGERSTRRREG
jgi:hypothetical protein